MSNDSSKRGKGLKRPLMTQQKDLAKYTHKFSYIHLKNKTQEHSALPKMAAIIKQQTEGRITSTILDPQKSGRIDLANVKITVSPEMLL